MVAESPRVDPASRTIWFVKPHTLSYQALTLIIPRRTPASSNAVRPIGSESLVK